MFMGWTPRRIDAAARAGLIFLSRLCDWRSCLVIVRPITMIRWHRVGWRLFWRWKARPGRPRIPLELRQLIRHIDVLVMIGPRIGSAPVLWSVSNLCWVVCITSTRCNQHLRDPILACHSSSADRIFAERT